MSKWYIQHHARPDNGPIKFVFYSTCLFLLYHFHPVLVFINFDIVQFLPLDLRMSLVLIQACESHDHDHQWTDYAMV